MNLTLHLIRKDLRQFRLLTLFWAALVAAQVLFTNWLLFPDTSDISWYTMMCNFVNLFYFLGLVFGYLFAGMIVLADPPASSVAQWQTRPVSGGRMLAAKAVVGVLILGVLTVLLWLPWWIYCGFGIGDMTRGALLVLAASLIPALLGAALAAVVDQAARFMMLTMILVAALILFAVTALVPQTISPNLLITRLCLDLACFVAVALVALVTQYQTRQVVKSGAVLIAGVAIVLMVRTWWPVDLVPWWSESHAVLAGAEKISGRIWRAELGSRNNKDGIAEPFIVVKLGLTGVPEEVFVSGGIADVELSWPDGTIVRREKLFIREDDWYSRWVPLQHALGFPAKRNPRTEHWDPETQAKNAALRAEWEHRLAERNVQVKTPRYVLPADLGASVRCEIPVSPAIAAKARATPPVCRIVATLRTKRPVILGEIPFVRGATIVHDGRLRVVKIERKVIEQNRPEQLGVMYFGGITLAKPVFSHNSSLYLVDRTHQTVGEWLSYNTIQGIAPVGGGTLSYFPFGFQSPSLWRTDRWVEVPDWQKTFTLVEEESRPAGSFTYDLTTERLEISESAEP